MPANGTNRYIQNAVQILAGKALAKDLSGFIPNPDTGPATITQQHTRHPANSRVYFFSLSLLEVNNTMLMVMKAMISSVNNAPVTPNFPGTVTAELIGASIKILPIIHCI